MKLAKKRIAREAEAPKKLKVGATQIQAGQGEELLVETDKHSSNSGSTQMFHPSAKIKLQLFPLNEVTRMGLEKDGYHPYLELTLSSRKKISSVLKHLNSKWGGSSIAAGEPMLFPCILSEDLASYRWTLNDDDLTAGDVYVSIGSPSIFRLRYGWFSDCENKSSGVPSNSTLCESFLQPEGMQKGCSNNLEGICTKQKHIEATSEDLKPTIVSGAGEKDAIMADKMPSNALSESMHNEVKMHIGIGQTSSLWDDSLTNVSIGGLLSEASLEGRFSNCEDPKSDRNNAGLQPSQLISDSFDAFLMAQVNYSQAPMLPPHGSTSSILDAEDTCHAFPFQKNSSSSKDALALGGSAYSHNCSQDAVSKSFKHPNISEVNIQSSPSQRCVFQESETDLSLCSRSYNDESSLGLSGIKWMDSLGPFDLGLSSSRKIINSDSLSISRIIS